MKILVIGTGLIGGKLAHHLKLKGHEVVAASPATGVNSVTGEGLDQAMNGMDVVVDLANSPTFDEKSIEFFEMAGRHLAAAEKKAGVKYHVALSIVGADRLQESAYLRAKIAQEDAIKTSETPYTIVRSTQFFEFVPVIAQAATEGAQIRVSNIWFQPISSDDVAQMLMDVVLGQPKNGVIEIAGPDRFKMTEILELYLKQARDPRSVVVDENYIYFGARPKADSLVPKEGSARLANTHYRDWISSHLPNAA